MTKTKPMTDNDMPAEVPGAARRQPSQQRSRERVERMLAAAQQIIAERGSDALRMADVAERAGVSIGSLYQFFPDKAAIIRSLAERCTSQSRACIEDGLAAVTDDAGLRQAFAGLVDAYYAMFLDDPAMCDIWSGMQADKGLRALEVAESRITGAMLGAAIRRVRPDADPAETELRGFLIMHLGEATMRLAVAVPRDEGDRLVAAYKAIADTALAPG
ncbi:TetR family transcriptional regulator [Tistrella bauzanensis]|uniref:TetR family transcriptional regulator n=1 Tax=Tistrella bauzanensis TaxID=657419 RepID=A0ABQ1IV14_9PROT|nr:TetR/AcrR family transcriptional regulator [Tistrella bauzanensis]GGB53170.1 TetR family transcriptional regulator [Tistrella bauzanensis]